MPTPALDLRSFRVRLTLALASGVAYALLYLAIHARFGIEPIALAAVPLVAGGLLFGVRGGLAAWVLVLLLYAALHLAIGLGPNIFAKEAPVRVVVALMVGVLVGRLRDLTGALEGEAAKRHEAALHREKAEAQLRITLMAIPDLVFRIARDGTFLDYHAGNAADLFVPAERIRGNKVGDLMPTPFTARIMAALEKTLVSGLPQVTEYELRMPQGPQEYEARMVVSGPDEVLTIVRNVTERKKLEEILRQRERERIEASMKDQLVVADRQAALGTLAAGAAHEINNPLAYVIANLGFLGRRLQDLVAGAATNSVSLERTKLTEMQDVVRETAEGAERVRVIVRDLKTYARPDDDRTDLVDVRVLLESSISMARKELAQRASLVRDYSEVAAVKANPTRIGQVFLNVLLNAAQAIPAGCPEGNEIRVVARMDGPAFVLVEIHDTGSGIPPAVRDHIFNPFFTTKEIGVGTGLGLYTCRNLVTALGGTIAVESEVGRGTVFRIRLPASEKVAEPDESVGRAHPGPGRRGRVLVVDDEPSLGRAIRLTLGSEHEVVVAATGKEALGHLSAGERFDVILCDLMMPGMTGINLYGELSRFDPAQQQRMIFMSGGAVSNSAGDFLRTVPNAQVEKPFAPEQLLALVRELVGR